MNRINLRVLWSTLSGVLILVLGALPGVAGDEEIFSTQIAPNVVLMVDNSGSMNAIMEHPTFDATTFAPTCNVIPDGSNGGGTAGWSQVGDDNGDLTWQYCWDDLCIFATWSGAPDWQASASASDDPLQGYVEREYCGQTRKLFSDGINETLYGNLTWHYPGYIEFLFSIDDTDNATLIGPPGEQMTAPQIIADLDDDTNGIQYIGGATFAKFQLTRITAARDIARDVIYQTNTDCPAFLPDCGTYEDRVRFGVAQFHGSAHGGFVNAPVDEYSVNKTDLDAAINSLDASTSTPLGETLFKLYTYFMSRNTAEIPFGQNGTTKFPAYVYNETDGDYTATSADRPPDPMVEECQKNFVIMITDGEPTADTFDTSGSDTAGFSNFDPQLVGDYAPDAVGDPDIGVDATPEVGVPPWSFSSGAGYLDDIALYMQETDCRLDYPGTMNVVDVYTVGFTTTGPVNSLLAKTAANGNGLYFNGNQAEELTEALVDSVQDIISKSQGFSAATVPAARTADGGNLYTTLFQPTSDRPFWPGLLRSYEITVEGEILDRNGACALTNLAVPGECTGGTFQTEDLAPPYWNASKAMPGANNRYLRVSTDGGATQTIEDWDVLITAADLGGALGAVNDYPVSANVVSTTDLDEAVVSFIAGCEWGTGLTAGGGDNFFGCVDRTRVENGSTIPDRLGDIFHSNPVVVGPPTSYIEEYSYSLYASDPTYAERDRLIIAGANDGFLHGFDAGDYQAGTGLYNEGTGVEIFGFMPWGAREKVMNLAKDDATLHEISVDGSPAVSDVWIDRNSNPLDAKVASEWSTVLVTGLREGGEHYLAMDVTDPATSGYPAYMWEFPREGDVAWRAYIGETWSQPVITRVKLDNSGGDMEETWVAIVGFGYDASGDPNDVALYDVNATKGRGVMMINIETGQPVAVRKFGSGTGDIPEMQYAMPSSPGVLDYDQDGFADLVYIGDLGGNVWKWVIRNHGTADPTAAQLYQPNWSFRKFFEDETTRSPTDHARSFYFAPSATIVSGILHIGLGTGERSDLNCTSADGCTLLNRFYSLKDRDVWDGGILSPIDGREYPVGDLTDATPFEDECAAVGVQPKGYFFEVPDGEKFVTNSEVFNRFFFISTFQPDLINVCEPAGIATLYGFLAKCGQGFFGPPSPTSPVANTDRSLDLGKGMPTDARLSIAPGDGGNRMIISKQDGELINFDSGNSDSEHGTMYWRELD